MTLSNKELAGKASDLAKGSDGLRRRAALCVSVACATTTSLAAAQRALEEIDMPDVRTAAVALLGELSAEEEL